MKRKLLSLLLCLLLCTMLVLPASAAKTLVMDAARLMTSEEAADLTRRSEELQVEFGMDVVILTIPNLMGKSPQDFADDFYDNNGYSPDGVLFLLDMGSRQWHISTAGTASSGLSDSDLIRIEEKVIPYFSEGTYYDGFIRFMDMLPDLLTGSDSSGGVNLFLSLIIGAAIAGIGLLIMRSTMNTKQPQRSADQYQSEGTYHLRTHQDLFLYSNITKRPRPRENSGSSTHRSSSGRSHGGRGGSF